MVGHDVRVLELEDARWRALLSNDVAELDELFSDDLSYTHSNAMMDTKSSYLGALRTVCSGTTQSTAPTCRFGWSAARPW